MQTTPPDRPPRNEPSPTPDDLDALLARGRLGGPRREEIADRVLAARAARSSRLRMGLMGSGAALALAAGVLLFVGQPRQRYEPDVGGEFGAKGAGAKDPVLEVVCATGGIGTCARGEELLFRVEGARDGGFLEAWAEPAGGGERTWYFAGAGALPVAPSVTHQTLKRAVKLGPQTALGPARVHLLLSRTPLVQEDALAVGDGRGNRNDVAAEAVTVVEVTP